LILKYISKLKSIFGNLSFQTKYATQLKANKKKSEKAVDQVIDLGYVLALIVSF
jgi:hypothetical protein